MIFRVPVRALMTIRTAGKRRAAVIVAENQETTGSSEPKRQASVTQPPQSFEIVVLLVLLICSPHGVKVEAQFQRVMTYHSQSQPGLRSCLQFFSGNLSSR